MEELADFDTERVRLMFKIILTQITLKSYRNNRELIQAENICRKSCLQNYQVSDQEQNVFQYIDQFEHCLKDCTAGS